MVRTTAASLDYLESDSRAGVYTKKKSVLALERESQRVQCARKAYEEAVDKIERSRLVFVDETGTHVALTRTHAWTRSGVRATGRVPLTGVAGALLAESVLLWAVFASWLFLGGVPGTTARGVLLAVGASSVKAFRDHPTIETPGDDAAIRSG